MPKGFVRTGAETNDEYIEAWKDDTWYEPIRDAHDLLSHFIPGYQITQIKEKFGDLTFYYVLPVDLKDVRLYKMLADHIIGWAVVRCRVIDADLSRIGFNELDTDEEE